MQPPLGILVPLIPTIDNSITRLHIIRQGGDGLVDRGPGLDEDDDGSGPFEGQDEVLGGVVAG